MLLTVFLCIAALMMIVVPIGKSIATIVGIGLLVFLLCDNVRMARELARLRQPAPAPPPRRDDDDPTILKFPGVGLILFILIGLAGSAIAEQPIQMMELSDQSRNYCFNPDGSCVQCSLVMCGFHGNNPIASRLLWDSEYGPAVRGGSNPSRVAKYCNERGIEAWNVTGQSINDTMPWIEYAARTGRFAAIGLGTQHFQTLYGFDPETRIWFVCNNQTPGQIDRYTDAQFRQKHRECMAWCVILKNSSSPPPRFLAWKR